MSVGISTACFYPAATEEALRCVAEAGAKVTEVFFNSPSELEPDFLRHIGERSTRAVGILQIPGRGPVYLYAHGNHQKRADSKDAEKRQGKQKIHRMGLELSSSHEPAPLSFRGITVTSGIRLEPMTS